MIKRSFGLAALLASVACGSVAPSVDGRSEGDQDRDLARGVFLDHTVTDRLDGGEGDNTDWKYVDVAEQGTLRVTVAVDRPDSLRDAEVVFYDEFGGLLKRHPVEPQENVYVFELDIEKIPNKFFVRAFTKDGSSTYTVGARLTPPPPPPAPVASPEPPPAPPTAPPVVLRAPVKAPPTVKLPTPKPETPEPAPAFIAGDVVRVIPADDQQSVTIAIRLRQPGDVAKGARGWVLKGGSRIEGARLTVTTVHGQNVQARVGLPPGKFSGALQVQIETQ